MNGLLDTFTANFLGLLYFSKLNVFLRLSVGRRGPDLVAFVLQVHTSRPHTTPSKANDDCKAQTIHDRDLVKIDHTVSVLLLKVRSPIRYDEFYQVSFMLKFCSFLKGARRSNLY